MTKETLFNSTASNPSPGSFPVELEGLVDENTVLVQRTLRSGQSIYHDGNVVILGDVNPGAEVVASGNIIVMGSLRGVVHAGAKGDTNAIILAFRLRPTQLRIGNHITRPPEDESSDPDYPELARIKNGVVTIETFNSVIR
ncbi:septum site-determining protein MinC [Desulforamulus putei]|uniref:Septum site-determining protein MinC n=1 Tax=Desulforamulus putei DSM 12395 TaxID=1121429 RepID=A0A1M4U854_9FIRM|nr:septum site-determining protein MinC [Desulforamulus putei]SHE53051.1 septum site-determining protein MinC [Desulforamulus putei DSM 12395]